MLSMKPLDRNVRGTYLAFSHPHVYSITFNVGHLSLALENNGAPRLSISLNVCGLKIPAIDQASWRLSKNFSGSSSFIVKFLIFAVLFIFMQDSKRDH